MGLSPGSRCTTSSAQCLRLSRHGQSSVSMSTCTACRDSPRQIIYAHWEDPTLFNAVYCPSSIEYKLKAREHKTRDACRWCTAAPKTDDICGNVSIVCIYGASTVRVLLTTLRYLRPLGYTLERQETSCIRGKRSWNLMQWIFSAVNFCYRVISKSASECKPKTKSIWQLLRKACSRGSRGCQPEA